MQEITQPSSGILNDDKKRVILQCLGESVGAVFPYIKDAPEGLERRRSYDIQFYGDGYPGVLNKVEAVVLTGNLRFGNQIIEIINALYFAQISGIKLIYCSPKPFFISSGECQVNGVTITFRKEDLEGQLCIAGPFLYFKTLHSKTGIPLKEFFKITGEMYNVLLGEDLKKDCSCLGPKDLVIHLRSGDVFKAKKPNVTYAQPPLAYYLKVFDLANPERVILVYEDERNPCIFALQEHLRLRNIPCINFCKNLLETIALLLQAKNICFGKGTFVPQIIFLSLSKKDAYVYSFNMLPLLKLRQKCDRVVLIKERNSDYIQTVLQEWRNHGEQKRKMIDYQVGDFDIEIFDSNSNSGKKE